MPEPKERSATWLTSTYAVDDESEDAKFCSGKYQVGNQGAQRAHQGNNDSCCVIIWPERLCAVRTPLAGALKCSQNPTASMLHASPKTTKPHWRAWAVADAWLRQPRPVQARVHQDPQGRDPAGDRAARPHALAAAPEQVHPLSKQLDLIMWDSSASLCLHPVPAA